MDRYSALFAAVSLWIGIASPAARAGMEDLEMNCVAKKFDQAAKVGSAGGDANVTREQWGYEVTLENKAFKDLTGLEIKYITFYKTEQLAPRPAPS